MELSDEFLSKLKRSRREDEEDCGGQEEEMSLDNTGGSSLAS